MKASAVPALAFAAALAAGCAEANDEVMSPEPSFVESAAFAEGGTIPIEHTCDGQDEPPPLRWDAVHPGAEELVILVDDDDAEADGRRFAHWMVAALPPADGEVPAGALPGGAVEGVNDFGEAGWRGPCPPRGDGAHTYRFQVIALDRPSGLQPGFSVDEFVAATRGHELAAGVLTGRYERAE